MYNEININHEIFKFTRLGANFIFFLHEFQHLINGEIAFITGNKKFFNSNKIGLEKSVVKIESLLFGKTLFQASYLQFYYLLNYGNFNKKIQYFKKEFNIYIKLKEKEIY